METSMERARDGLASARARQGLTEAKLRELQPRERAFKVTDGGNGLYVVISPSGSRSFRYDYRLSGRRVVDVNYPHPRWVSIRSAPTASRKTSHFGSTAKQVAIF